MTKTNCDKQNFPNQFHLHLTLHFKSCSFNRCQPTVEVVSGSSPAIMCSDVSLCFSVLSASGSVGLKTENVEEEEEEDREEVFTVELHRGPHGLGLALVDGTVRPLPHFSSPSTFTSSSSFFSPLEHLI